MLKIIFVYFAPLKHEETRVKLSKLIVFSQTGKAEQTARVELVLDALVPELVVGVDVGVEEGPPVAVAVPLVGVAHGAALLPDGVLGVEVVPGQHHEEEVGHRLWAEPDVVLVDSCVKTTS